MSYWRLYYHIVWGTKRREALLDADRLEPLERSIRATCHDLGALPHAAGIMPDHVHLAVSIPPKIAISDAIQRIKGESSYLLNHAEGRGETDWFAWQPEYGVISFGERSLKEVLAYVTNQRSHHANQTLWSPFEIVERERPTPRPPG